MKARKFLFYAMMSMLLTAGCSGDEGTTPPDDSGNTGNTEKAVLTASVTPTVIKANGEDIAHIEVLFNNEPVSINEVTFYDNTTNEDLGWTTYDYRTTTVGSVTFWVSYKTYNTKNKPLTIKAEEPNLVPEKVDDPQPENTSFVHRSLLIDFTSVKCGYCPLMAATMNALAESESYCNKVVLTACHCSGMGEDPFVSSLASSMEQSVGVSGYPCMLTDFRFILRGTYTLEQNIEIVGSYIDESLKDPAKVGISATVMHNETGAAILATVKAAESGKYRIGAFLLEDGLFAQQTNYTPTLSGDFDTHNHVVRIIDSKKSSTDFTGHELGEIAAGETMEYLFNWNLSTSWKKENCSIVIFVTTKNEQGAWVVTNAVHLDTLDGKLPFEYNE